VFAQKHKATQVHPTQTNHYMKIIADSGATKTDWCLINGAGEVQTVQTVGLNPYFLDEDEILNVLRKDLYPYLDNKKVEQVYFYGAGCALPHKRQVLQFARYVLYARQC